ncbi:MAG: AP2/ERF family transcription factor, partial [Solirubrobacterales bacterium]
PEKGLPRPMPRKRGRKVKRIPLGDGLFALVDAADYKEISKHRWYATYRGRNVYATCFVNRKPVYMHRMIMRPRRGYIVDHKDGNGLNNCRDNLRVCTRRQNQANRRSRHGTSQFVGVYRHKNGWVAEITSHGRFYYLGYFSDEVEAAKARDRKAWELHGEFAYLNFPEDYAKKRRKRRVRA